MPERVRPAETDLAGICVLKFGGASVGKLGRSTGLTGARGRGLGELEREFVDGARLMAGIRLADEVGRLVGVEDLELSRETIFEFEGVCDLEELGVDGLELLTL